MVLGGRQPAGADPAAGAWPGPKRFSRLAGPDRAAGGALPRRRPWTCRALATPSPAAAATRRRTCAPAGLAAHRTQPAPGPVVGHSMGGAVALRYAATHPEQVTQLVLVDAAGILERSSFLKTFRPSCASSTARRARWVPPGPPGQGSRRQPGGTERPGRRPDRLAEPPMTASGACCCRTSPTRTPRWR
ncbi:MAG: alpha/beta fold hydrolase [Inhella sp.]